MGYGFHIGGSVAALIISHPAEIRETNRIISFDVFIPSRFASASGVIVAPSQVTVFGLIRGVRPVRTTGLIASANGIPFLSRVPMVAA